jgi:predicted dehydrogenase
MNNTGGKLRVGIIGAGGIGGHHAKYYQQCNDAEVLAACDVSEKSLASFGARFPGVRLFPNRDEMFDAVELDAVSVCTPNSLHCDPTVDALNRGCHVMVEKPMAKNAAEAQQMLDAAKKNNRRLVIGFQHRFDGRIKVLKRAFDQGVFGKILYVRIQALRRRGIPNWGVFGRKDLQGGGPLIDIGVHALEMAHYTIGMPEPAAATGSTWTYMGNKPSDTFSVWPNWDYKTYTVEDLAVGHLRMKNGAVIHIESSFAAHIEKDVWNFQVLGEKGGATFDPLMVFQDQAGSMLNSVPAFIPSIDVFEAKMRNFVDACLKGAKSEAPGEHGLIVQKMLDGIYASAERGGKEVAID